MKLLRLCLPVLLLCASEARALEQLVHRSLTRDACVDAGLPDDFCVQAGVADSNVDAHEWDLMAAHAQADSPDALCDGANATLAHVHEVAQRARDHALDVATAGMDGGVRETAALDLAEDLGRALHALQDLCAHEGMTNVQHAWFSAADQCLGTTSSPDVQGTALDCARSTSEDVFPKIADALAGLGATPDLLGDLTVYESRVLPRNHQLCEYLLSAGSWDGVDRRWRVEVMRPALGAALLDGLQGRPLQEVACDDLSAAPRDPVDTSGGAPWCASAEAVCQSAGRSGPGCGCQGGIAASGLWLGLLVLAAATRRRGSRSVATPHTACAPSARDS